MVQSWGFGSAPRTIVISSLLLLGLLQTSAVSTVRLRQAHRTSQGNAQLRTTKLRSTAGHRPTIKREPARLDRHCPEYDLDWRNKPANSTEHGIAAVFTPYHITFGGGEKYLLQTVSVLQSMGYNVDVLVAKENLCQTKTDLSVIADGLRVPLSMEQVEVITVDIVDTKIMSDTQYDVFFLLGNEKYAGITPLGTVNFYVCQFPFDLGRDVSSAYRRVMDLYDIVLVYSQFSLNWYSRFIEPVFLAAKRDKLLFPAVEVLNPPVDPFSPGEDRERSNIVLLGRFFEGRQSKGHHDAIELFRQVLPNLPQASELHFVGNLVTGHEKYLEKLQEKAQDLPIVFHVGNSASKVEEVLQDSLVLWHLTGIDADVDADPASAEHFGIAVAEGMSAGCIPIVTRKGGGVVEIVEHEYTGFLAESTSDFVRYTEAVFSLNSTEVIALRGRAIESVKKFRPEEFAFSLKTLIHKQFSGRMWKSFIRQTRSSVLARSFKLPRWSRRVAVIVETRAHFALEYAVKNVMGHLGTEWSLQVFHGRLNANFTNAVLSQVQGTHYTKLEVDIASVDMYNQLLKSADFWLQVRAQQVLLFQVDSVMIRSLDRDMFRYDYVGAPWHLANERWTAALPQGVGNGGFSLRNVQAVLDVIKQHGNTSGASEQEDQFYARHMVDSPLYSVAPRDVAYRFAAEVPCPDIEERLSKAHIPTAVHGSWYYYTDAGRVRQLQRFLEQSLCI